MSAIRFDSIDKRFDGVPAVSDFTLDVADGEFVVLVGPSGCGKTTSLRMLAGLEQPTRGRILLQGDDITHVPSKSRALAMVFQSYALYPHMSVFENISFALTLQKGSRAEIEDKVRRVASMLDIAHLLDRKPRALSGGQRQRVAVARAIVRDPRAFLFDEPLSNLDAKLRHAARVEIRKLQQDLGTTTVYVTHDQIEAMTMADRIVVMEAGRIRQIGRPMDLYTAPNSRFVASFLGSPPANFIEGHCVHENGAARFEGGFLSVPLHSGAAPGPASLGIRPENIRLGGDDAGAIRFRGIVRFVEALGAETLVDIGPDGRGEANASLTARLPGLHRLSAGMAVDVALSPRDLILFDAEGNAVPNAVKRGASEPHLGGGLAPR